jgi:hypothetical protein
MHRAVPGYAMEHPLPFSTSNTVRGQLTTATSRPVISPGGQKRHFSRSRHARVCAPAAPVKAGRLATPHFGVALTDAAYGAQKLDATCSLVIGVRGPGDRDRYPDRGRDGEAARASGKRGSARPREARVAQTILEIERKKDPHAGVSIHRRA